MLGLTSYYSLYVPDFDNLVAPLNDFTKNNATLTLIQTQECEYVFVRLKALWSLALQEYEFNVVHRKSVSNGNADTLSRMRMIYA